MLPYFFSINFFKTNNALGILSILVVTRVCTYFENSFRDYQNCSNITRPGLGGCSPNFFELQCFFSVFFFMPGILFVTGNGSFKRKKKETLAVR